MLFLKRTLEEQMGILFRHYVIGGLAVYRAALRDHAGKLPSIVPEIVEPPYVKPLVSGNGLPAE